ncbi:MAG: TonB-dependent receptor [Bacteroidota bacterium]
MTIKLLLGKTLVLGGLMLVQLFFASNSFAYPTGENEHSLNEMVRSINGTITKEDGAPLPGATVRVKGTQVGAISDTEGKFSMEVPDDLQEAVLVVSYIGYATQEIALDGQSTVEVQLEVSYSQLDEVVVVGYGTVKKRDLTGSVSSIGEDEFIKGFNNSPEQLIQGKIPGVTVTTGDGTPGGAVRVRIRGITSLRSDNDPLYIVDGVPIGNGGSSADGVNDNVVHSNSVAFLNPDDIEKIDVLKGPSAIAIYGSRAANGVVIITTRSGQAGQGFISFDSKLTLSKPRATIDVLSADEYRETLNRFDIPFSDGGANTNWQDEITRNAFTQSHTLSAGGGKGNTSYYASVGYMNEEGIVINNDMERISGRLKVNQSALNDRLRLGLNATASTIEFANGQVSPANGGGSRPGNLGMAIRYNPTQPVFNPDGTFNEVEFPSREQWNPVAMSEQPTDELHQENILANINVELDILPDLTVGTSLAYNNQNSERNIFYPSTSQFGAQTRGKAIKRTSRNYNYLMENILKFNKELSSKHTINALAGYSWQRFFNEGLRVEVEDFLIDNFTFDRIQSAGNVSSPPSSFRNTNTLISFFGRVNYSFNGRYLFTATVRRDGSSKFGENNKWGTFPSAAVGWRISEEAFLGEVDWLDDLKLRVEYGQVGNQGIPNFLSLETLNITDNRYNMGGGNFVNAVVPTQFSNPDLRWETTTTTNIGLDYGFFNGRINGTLDYYIKTTEDLLLEFLVPSPTVVNTVVANVGEMENSGFELGVNAILLNPESDWGLDITGNIAFNTNEVTNLSGAIFGTESIDYFSLIGPGFVGDNAFRIEEGRPIHSFYAFDFVGFNESGEELFLDEEGQEVTIQNGDPVRKYFDSAIPDYTFAITPTLRYKNFDASIFIRGAGGHSIVNNTLMSLGQPSWLSSGYNIVDGALDENSTTGTTHEYSDRFIEDASFVRIDNISLGYNFNVSGIGHISRIRLYAAARNLAVFSDYSGPDPEVFPYVRTGEDIEPFGVDYLAYPRPRMYTLGLNVNFN